MITFKQYIKEGPNDPAIFKAVFTAGGPGSGKSRTAEASALLSMGFRPINSDDAFEAALKKAGLTTSPEDIFSPRGQEIRKSAVELTGKKRELAIKNRLGMLIDGTGKDYNKIKNQVTELRRLGYEVAMIFVNTSLETALQRNRDRARSLPDSAVEKMWKDVQTNMGKFQNLFKGHMYIVDNNAGTDIDKAVIPAYKKISAWAKQEPRMPQAQAWLAPKKKA